MLTQCSLSWAGKRKHWIAQHLAELISWALFWWTNICRSMEERGRDQMVYILWRTTELKRWRWWGAGWSQRPNCHLASWWCPGLGCWKGPEAQSQPQFVLFVSSASTQGPEDRTAQTCICLSLAAILGRPCPSTGQQDRTEAVGRGHGWANPVCMRVGELVLPLSSAIWWCGWGNGALLLCLPPTSAFRIVVLHFTWTAQWNWPCVHSHVWADPEHVGFLLPLFICRKVHKWGRYPHQSEGAVPAYHWK